MKKNTRGHVRNRRQTTEAGVKETARRAAKDLIELIRESSRIESEARIHTHNLAQQDIQSIVFRPWQGERYMELEVECLFGKLSGRFEERSFGRICREGRRTLDRIVEMLDQPGKVHAHVLRQGFSPLVPEVSFLELQVVERDIPMGCFIAPEEFFRCCSRAVAYGFARR